MTKLFLPVLLALNVMVPAGPAPLLAQTIRTRDASGGEIVRRCQPAMSKKDLPLLSAVLDSGAVAQQLTGFPPGEADRWLLSLSVPKDGTTPAVRWLEPESGPDSVVQILSGAARQRKAGNPWAVRLRVALGSQVALTLEPAVYCPPQPIGLTTTTTEVIQIRPGDRLPTAGRQIRMSAEVLVLETGAVADAQVLRSSGIRELDDSFVQRLKQTPFLPALLDGMRVEGRYRTDGSSPRP